MKSSQSDQNGFLPNFCKVHAVFLSIIITELLAFVLVLAKHNQMSYDLESVQTIVLTDLAMVSLFMQWLTLVNMGLLCGLRSQFYQLESDSIVGLVSYLLILMVTMAVSEIAWWVNELMLSVESLWSATHHRFLLTNLAISALISALVLGYFYRYHFLKKSVAILVYLIIIIATFILTEWISVGKATPSHYYQAIEHQWFLWRNLAISAIISAIALRYFYVQYQWKKETEALAYARAQALQARIRPHFLFNCMNTIASLIRFQPKQAEQAVIDFADLFRASLAETKICVTFSEELTLCRQYLGLEALRLGERLQVVWQIDCIPADALLPPLSLQPLLENAIYHGIQPLLEGGTIGITGAFDGQSITLDIENPLAETLSYHRGNRIAQQNIQQRFLVFYGSLAKLSVDRHANTYHVILYFPYKKNQYDEDNYRR